jgi:hypothetical protein
MKKVEIQVGGIKGEDFSDIELPQVVHIRNGKTPKEYQALIKEIKGLAEADKPEAILHLIKCFEKES